MRQTLLTIGIALLLPLGVALAAAPPDAVKRAAALHKKAVATSRRGDKDAALELWRQAEKLHPFWKYAINQAAILDGKKRYAEAFFAYERAGRLGIPKRHRKTHRRLLERVRKRLQDDHALVQLSVHPDGAQVTLDGKPWPPPWRAWLPTTSSRVVVTKDGFEPYEFVWEHPRGQVIQRVVQLAKVSSGSLRVFGTPAGAEVLLDGRVVGRLPDVTVPKVAPGKHKVVVRHVLFTEARKTVAVAPGRTTSWKVALKPLVGHLEIDGKPAGANVAVGGRAVGRLPLKPVPLEPGRYEVRIAMAGFGEVLREVRVQAGKTTRLAVELAHTTARRAEEPATGVMTVMKWVTLGTGLALAGAGIGLIAHSEGLISKTADLDPSAPDYDQRFDENKEAYEATRPAGIALTAVGGAALVGSVLLFVFDRPSAPDDTSWRVAPWAVRGGAGLTLRVY